MHETHPKPPPDPDEIFPGPFAAFMLPLAGLFAAPSVAAAPLAAGVIEPTSLMAAMGVGYALGLGGIDPGEPTNPPAP